MAQVRDTTIHEKELYTFILDSLREDNELRCATVAKPDLRLVPPPEQEKIAESLLCEELVINVGPQHPSTHGVYRAMVTIDGERVTNINPQIGYLHRCFEKIAENRTYGQFLPYTDRMDYISSMLTSWGYAMAVEKLAGIEVPERAEYLRVIVGELNRIASHLIYYSAAGLDTGALTPFFWLFESRENVLDLFEAISGARQTYNYMRIGGVAADAPTNWLDDVTRFLKEFKSDLADLENVLLKNYIFKKRMIDVGVLPVCDALDWGATGPVLRASGVANDLRKDEPYSVYERFEFDVPIGLNGDNYDRTVVRFEEMKQSSRIIEQAVEQITNGPFITPGLPRLLCPPPGEVVGRIESSKGELGYYIVSNGGPKPFRVKIMGPSFANLQLLPAIATGSYVADMITILGTLDPVFGEVDR